MKKVLKIAFFCVLGLIVVAYLFLLFSYNGYKPSEVEHEIVPAALDYFHETYEDCRSAFIEKATLLGSQYEGVEISKIPVTSKVDSDLTIDYCYVPAQSTSNNLLILSSGIHGVEAFLGNAVQLMTMEEILNPEHLDTTGILIIHGMNPWGIKHLRHVTENNVNLNRNCVVDKSLLDIQNEEYKKLYDMLNPQGEANHGNLKNRHMHLVMGMKILAGSMSALRQAILQGQYEYPAGLMFGSKELEPQISAIMPILKEKMAPYNRILAIDLHTGYGGNGILYLFPNPVKDADIKAGMEELFSGYRIDWGDSDDFYTYTGSFTDFIGTLMPGKTVYPMLFEYGTMDSLKTFGSLRSLHNMILENQGFHHGYKNKKTEAKIKENFLEQFYPSDKAWRSKVIMDSKEILELVLDRFGID